MKKIQILGNVTKDAEVRHLESGQQVLNFTVAVNSNYKNKQGEKVEKTDFFDCFQFKPSDKQFGIAPYITRGKKVVVDGEPQADAYVNNEGKAIGKIKIKINEVYFAGGSAQSNDPLANEPAANLHNDFTSSSNDDLPF